MGIEWTDAQNLAISEVDQNLLVSAAAGSGKTTVLAERCVNLVCDAQSPCDVDDLLVVTFTEAAAAQMKARIGQSLRNRAGQQPDDALKRQLALIDHAQVSTLHGFCARLLRQHFHQAQIDPAFRILDGDEANLLRRDVARQLLRESYGSPTSAPFEQFVDSYAQGDDERLLKLIVGTHEMLCSLRDPNQWMRDARDRIRDAATLPLADTELGAALHRWIADGLASLVRQCESTLQQLRRWRFAPYEKYVAENLAPAIRHWKQIFESDGIDALSESVGLDFPKLPSTPAALANKELAQAAVNELRGSMKEGPWRDALRFSTVQWQAGLKATLPHAMAFLNLIGQFARRYRAEKDSLRALDFADLERFSFKVLSDNGKPSAAARAYHQRFRHVLVDEYQDINELQDEILRLLSHESTSERQKPNQFYVGDVKQSIYRFRLADPERFLDREHRWRSGEGGQVIDLKSNFRSRKPLIEAINAVFERLMIGEPTDIEYNDSHRLVAERLFPPPAANAFAGSPIELHLLPQNFADESDSEESTGTTEPDRTEREAMFVARRIRELMGLAEGSHRMLVRNDENTLRPIEYRDIVILLRSMRYKSEQFARVLAEVGIPVHADSVTGYFQSMEVRDMLALLRVLDNRQQDIPLATVLRSPFGRLPNADDAMARIRLAYPGDDNGHVAFHQAVVRYSHEKKDELAAHLRDLLAQLRGWRESAQRRPLDEVLWDIYQESGYLAYCQGLSNGDQRAANLMLLQEKASQFGAFQRQGLSRFLEFLESLHDDADIGLPSTASSAANVVRIMSVHRSKGLEFPVVILPDLGKRINLQDCQGAILTDRKMGLGLHVVDDERRVRYPSLASTLLRNRLRQQAMAEELRVLYVAMTRAEEHLILVGTVGDKTADRWASRWPNHAGPLPAEEILGASTMLDWIGPVAAATQGAFAITRHGADEVAGWTGGTSRSANPPPRLAALQPLETPPPQTDAAQAVIKRLELVYPFADATKTPAVQSVTGHSQPAETEPHRPPTSHKLEKVLERPRFLLEQALISATERGTATHLVLQHLDFRRPCDAADVAEQIAGLIERRSLTTAEASAVDHQTIAWFVGMPLGQLLREHAEKLRREIPVYFTLDDPKIAPADRKMIRGRLDLLLPLEDGHVIVDYKTDAVDQRSAVRRAEEYRSQMELYRSAIGRITRQLVREIHLVFLTPRCVVTL